ncbi:MAG: Asp-tRNA(Asn)/Glu-tRNA(Gln) amidotransferase subunit GatB [Candidatus Aenigmarchaeota archaeon]|nr:Asp-tRNA(Asn)/Glu-tRNA(Gln) amidotransferase subunit GatB [Candidatus Aenigmarchaeota archaeon]MDI6722436.1 Asp-tRNA(Asn)/Glu-tRNA(Gln) amidotransferase subunit GatB [Candidatus Aenigmarchaeota archaeon]
MKIGLEVHVQLSTKTKMFCGCENSFSSEPNTYVCEYCIGLPGSKPRVNRAALEAGIRVAIALSCKLPSQTFFSRKSYFYPDMGKNFQITQYEIPLATGGKLVVGSKEIRIKRINLEEDPARIVHEGGSITTACYVLVDYNRSGVPLCEIVTDPDFRSPKETRMFLQELSSMLQYLNIFNPDIEGSMRVDANISLDGKDLPGIKGSPRVEIKNISGFKDIEKALDYEVVRQRTSFKRKKEIVQETRSWDAAAGVTRSLRTKEGEEDYGYIFEGDIPKIQLAQEKISELRATMPEFARDKIKKYMLMGIQEGLAVSIASEPDLAEMFERVIKIIDPDLAARWFAGEIKKTLNYSSLRLRDTGIKDYHITKMLQLVQDKRITEHTAEMLFRDIIKRPQDPEEIMKKSDIKIIHDEEKLENIVREVMEENSKALLDYKSGRKESFNFLVGQVMRKTQGRGDPVTIRKLLQEMLK